MTIAQQLFDSTLDVNLETSKDIYEKASVDYGWRKDDGTAGGPDDYHCWIFEDGSEIIDVPFGCLIPNNKETP